MPTHLKRVLNQARLETESYDTMVQHLEKEMELNGLSDPIDNNITGNGPRSKKRPEKQETEAAERRTK